MHIYLWQSEGALLQAQICMIAKNSMKFFFLHLNYLLPPFLHFCQHLSFSLVFKNFGGMGYAHDVST
jgi:hypothetical protein